MMPSLLLVHANTDDREMYAEYLSVQGFRVTQAETTDAALLLIPGADAVITGLLVPGSFDGVELIVRIRRDAQTSEKPIIVVTASTFSHQVERARRAGANVVLMKPCLPVTLLGEVRRFLEGGLDLCAAPEPASPDRRRLPDRRAKWRGGRRDIDWKGRLRPPGAPTRQ
jgi:CheY-like chemotaxis protein